MVFFQARQSLASISVTSSFEAENLDPLPVTMSFTSPMTGLIKFSVSNTKPQVKLFRDICKELPRVLTIFDLDLDEKQVPAASQHTADSAYFS